MVVPISWSVRTSLTVDHGISVFTGSPPSGHSRHVARLCVSRSARLPHTRHTGTSVRSAAPHSRSRLKLKAMLEPPAIASPSPYRSAPWFFLPPGHRWVRKLTGWIGPHAKALCFAWCRRRCNINGPLTTGVFSKRPVLPHINRCSRAMPSFFAVASSSGSVFWYGEHSTPSTSQVCSAIRHARNRVINTNKLFKYYYSPSMTAYEHGAVRLGCIIGFTIQSTLNGSKSSSSLSSNQSG